MGSSILENLLVERIIAATWRLKRAIRVESEFINAEFNDCRSDSYAGLKRSKSESWSLLVNRHLGESSTWLNLTRYETSIEKQLYKALHELQRVQSARKGEKPPLPVALDIDLYQEG